MKYNFSAIAQRNYEEEKVVYWTKGRTYTCMSDDMKTIHVLTDQGTIGTVGPKNLMSFDEIFKTEFRLDVPPEFLSNKAREEIYRTVWAEYVKEDILCRAEEQGIDVDEAKAEELAELYVHGQYDCNLSYWDNIDVLLHNILPTAAEGFFERLTAMVGG